ncbi:hypothetical protein RIF29_27505 [Crotalaria pallida]|uniref:Uncharacterized protein n=1 Tax=Crotalaria pallida TaxID=3830 RepID=A0AAN9ERD6_CROPI
MTEVLHSLPYFASSPSTTTTLTTPTTTTLPTFTTTTTSSSSSFSSFSLLSLVALVAFLVTLLRKSFSACRGRRYLCSMDIGDPTNVRHVAHVTFDRFNGFLGLPDEFEPDVPRRPPSASATVFGVSTESMQLSFDSRGNSVPTILLLMQRHLYAQGGLQAEGIFRINADNSHEEYVRDQLNLGLIPEGIDVHCLAGLIKAWFRELPAGILDPLSQEQVMQCQTEEEYVELVRQLPHTEAALLDWAINLMADVVEHEHLNKMNARNVAVVFAPNMTQMADPFNALVYAVQVMNLLKTLILRTLQERKDSVVESTSRFHFETLDENAQHSILESSKQDTAAENEQRQQEQKGITTAENEEAQENLASKKPVLECSPESLQNDSSTGGESCCLISSSGNLVCNGELYCEFPPEGDLYCEYPPKGNVGKSKSGQSSSSNARKGPKKTRNQQPVEKKGIRTLDSSKEAWR